MINERNSRSNSRVAKAMVSVSIGVLVSAIILSILIVIVSVALSQSGYVPIHIISQIVVVLSGLASFFAGFTAAKCAKCQGLMYGALSGFVLFVIVALASMLILGEPFTTISLLRALLYVIAGSLGGVVGINKKKRRRA